jgi:hypothetical protein
MFENIEKRLEEILGVEHIEKSRKKEQKERFLDLVNAAQEKIIIVAGELSPRFYDGESGLPNIIGSKIAYNKNLRVQILFSKANANTHITKAEALNVIKRDNPKLIEVFTANRDKENNIEIYWAEKRPKFHFAICDNKLFIEEVHEPGEEKKVVILHKNNDLVAEYSNHFTKMKGADFVHTLSVNDFSQ